MSGNVNEVRLAASLPFCASGFSTAVTYSSTAPIDIWDDESWRDSAIRQVELARAVGALSLLPFAITQRVGMPLHAGEFATVAQLVDEFSVLKEATATGLPDFGAMVLAAWQGRSREAFRLIDEYVTDMNERGQGSESASPTTPQACCITGWAGTRTPWHQRSLPATSATTWPSRTSRWPS